MIQIETINEAGERLAQMIRREQPPFDGHAIVFIGAMGICVRRLQSLIHDKYTDPAVICIDTTGRYVIPVLSGHVGGANELARQLARITGGEAVITTQSDNAGLWSLDLLARQNGWGQEPLPREDMNHAIAAFVNHRPTSLIIEHEDETTRRMRDSAPSHVTVFNSYDDFMAYGAKSSFELLILVSPLVHTLPSATLCIQYCPRCLHLGIGCQKNAPVEIVSDLLGQLRQAGYSPQSVASIATIELKKDEPLLEALGQALPWAKVNIYTADQLVKIEVPNPSQKVFQVTGCYGVAEASALASAKRPNLLIEKQKQQFGGQGEPVYYTYAVAADGSCEAQGHIEIVGAGPGDPDLISVRGRRFLERADLILYAGSLVPRQLTECAKPGAVVRNSAGMNLEEQFLLMKDFYDRGMLVVRLHTGDPSLYGAIQEQMALFDSHGMHYHITPGISSFLAAAAELRCQYTIPERCQTVILTRGEGRTAVPERERLRTLAAHQSTMCIFLSASLASQVQAELLAGGYPPQTPVAVCHRLTWNDQQIFRGTLSQLASIMQEHNLTLTTMIVVGEAIGNRSGNSRLYDKHFTHIFRRGDDEPHV